MNCRPTRSGAPAWSNSRTIMPQRAARLVGGVGVASAPASRCSSSRAPSLAPAANERRLLGQRRCRVRHVVARRGCRAGTPPGRRSPLTKPPPRSLIAGVIGAHHRRVRRDRQRRQAATVTPNSSAAFSQEQPRVGCERAVDPELEPVGLLRPTQHDRRPCPAGCASRCRAGTPRMQVERAAGVEHVAPRARRRCRSRSMRSLTTTTAWCRPASASRSAVASAVDRLGAVSSSHSSGPSQSARTALAARRYAIGAGQLAAEHCAPHGCALRRPPRRSSLPRNGRAESVTGSAPATIRVGIGDAGERAGADGLSHSAALPRDRRTPAWSTLAGDRPGPASGRGRSRRAARGRPHQRQRDRAAERRAEIARRDMADHRHRRRARLGIGHDLRALLQHLAPGPRSAGRPAACGPARADAGCVRGRACRGSPASPCRRSSPCRDRRASPCRPCPGRR